MRRVIKSAQFVIAIYVAAALFVVAILTYLNYRLAVAAPGGVDFLTHYVGTRALFSGESPYSNDVARRVQNLVYGHSALPGENELLDCYFLYLGLVFAPFALIRDYTLARAAWMTLLELSSVAIFIISLRIVAWRPKRWALIMYLVYASLGYETIRPIINGNVTIVIALILVGAVWALKQRRDRVCGLLLALAFGKPNLTVVPILLLLVWSISLKRWHPLVWFVGSISILMIGGMLIIPDWPLQNLSNILRYISYNPPSTLPASINYYLPGPGFWIGNGISILLAVFLARAWIRSLRGDFHILLPVLCITLVASQWLWITTGPGNFIILALPTAQVLKALEERQHGLIWVAASIGTLMCGLWILFLLTVDRSQGNFQSPIMFFPLPLLLMIGMFFTQGWQQPSLPS